MTNQELEVWREFAKWLREKNDKQQEEIEREEGAENE